MSLLQVRNIIKTFGGVTAVADVSFDLPAGQLLALLGPNGAGKSTCFNMVNGQLRPDAGSIRFDGHELIGMAPRNIWRLGVGRTFQIAATFGSMTVLENVQMALLSHAGRVFRLWRPAASFYREQAASLLEQVGMAAQMDRPCSVLAYGDVKRVELAIALANQPKLLLMDEPTAGMAPKERNDLMALTKKLVVERNIAVLFTEHSMDVVFSYADRMIVLARGKLIAEGDAEHIRNHPKVKEVYFGTGKTFEKKKELGMSDIMLKIDHLNAWYGRAHILFDVSLQVRRGEVVALMGRNGAGKSTTMKAVMGLIEQMSGIVEFMGRDIARQDPYKISRMGLGFVPEDRRIFTDLTVMENLEVGRQAARAGMAAWTAERLFKLFPNLGEMPDRLGARMSGGEQQMLTVARTLMGNPYLVLLDEPSEGVAPLIVEQMANMIVELKKEGMAILLSEQNVHFAELVSDRVYVLEKGQIRYQGSMDELAADEEVRRAYLTV